MSLSWSIVFLVPVYSTNKATNQTGNQQTDGESSTPVSKDLQKTVHLSSATFQLPHRGAQHIIIQMVCSATSSKRHCFPQRLNRKTVSPSNVQPPVSYLIVCLWPALTGGGKRSSSNTAPTGNINDVGGSISSREVSELICSWWVQKKGNWWDAWFLSSRKIIWFTLRAETSPSEEGWQIHAPPTQSRRLKLLQQIKSNIFNWN